MPGGTYMGPLEIAEFQKQNLPWGYFPVEQVEQNLSLSLCHAVFEVLPCPLRLLGHVLHWRFLIPLDSPFLYTEWSVAKGFHWCHAAVLLPSQCKNESPSPICAYTPCQCECYSGGFCGAS